MPEQQTFLSMITGPSLERAVISSVTTCGTSSAGTGCLRASLMRGLECSTHFWLAVYLDG